MNGKDTYDISKYSDTELYNILDVINPTDRELEARILFLIHKYDNMQNKSGDELANFFRKIYAHFFEVSDDEDEETDLNDMVINGQVEGFTINPDGTVDYGNTEGNTWSITGNVENEIIDNYDKYNGNSVPRDMLMTQLKAAVKTTTQDKNSVAYVNTLNYTQDKLNPLLKQTIKRIISIDSQYRDDKRTLSTQFTFNLSDPLKDVLSIKLYSIQIPYTWYTISTSYGSNFFYLKGNSPGINDGNYDYQFSVAPGNYSPTELVTAINTNITAVKSNYKDVDFDNTQITYNSNTSRATIDIDITKTYNETSYYLDFPTWTNPNDDTTYNDTVNYVRKQSIPGFLGFNYQTYYPNILYSNYVSQPTDADTNSALYFIDPSANYFTIYKYIGPDEYNETTTVVDLSFQIKLSETGLVSRNDLIIDVSNELAKNTYLMNSSINRYNITDTSYAYDSADSSLNTYYYLKGQGYSQFQMAIKFNRLTTNNKKFSKIYIKFPTETSSTAGNPVWTGTSSCFQFPSITNELNNIIAETDPVPDQLSLLQITSSPYIYLKCIGSGYDISQNDYRIDISNNTTGYTLQGIVDNIQKALVNINTYTKTANVFYSNVALGTVLSGSITDVSLNPYFNINGDFNIDNTTASIDTNSYFNISFDINKKFTNDMYRVDTSGTSLKSLLSLSGDYLNNSNDLSGTYSFSSRLAYQSGYTLESGNLLLIYPSDKKYGNQNAGDIIVTTTGSGTTPYSYAQLQTSINNSFSNYKDSNGTNILDGTNIALNINTSTNETYIDCVFTIKIQKVISQDKYNILFYDASGYDDGNFNYTLTAWNQLAIDASFMELGVDLSSNISNITTSRTKTNLQMTEQILSNSIKFTNDNNYFYMKPYDAGVLSIDGANDIKITVPAYDATNTQIIYSRTSLIGAINNALSSSIYTYGSSLSIYTVNSIEYTKLRINVTKIYTTNDYKLVFYDQQSFVKCYTGVSSVTNTTWDTTLGWILGFRETTEYDMTDYYTSNIDPTNISYYTNDDYITNNKVSLTGDTSVSVNLFNYFLLCLDDFNQNHLNDGLVTLSSADRMIRSPSYANKSNFTCDPATGLLTYNTNIINPTTNSKLTQNQIYALTEVANGSNSAITSSSNISSTSFGTGPFVKDVFALIPIKTSGMQNGSVYVDFSGTLQNQERVYFGPVNIHRMSISLVSDRGDVVNLNGTNWSFSFLCEQLYQQSPSS